MTHEELLAKIKTGNEFVGIKYAPDSHTFALRAVVELHEPINSIRGIVCRHCFTDALNRTESYPCPTIQAIEKELI